MLWWSKGDRNEIRTIAQEAWSQIGVQLASRRTLNKRRKKENEMHAGARSALPRMDRRPHFFVLLSVSFLSFLTLSLEEEH